MSMHTASPAAPAPAPSQSDRYNATRRQQDHDGEWYLSPREFSRVVCVSYATRDYWKEHGIPILDCERPDLKEFPDGNGMMTEFWSETQAKRIVAARKVKP